MRKVVGMVEHVAEQRERVTQSWRWVAHWCIARCKSLARRFQALVGSHHAVTFTVSGAYWEARYAAGGDSGRGSRGVYARFKADVLNAFISEKNVQSAIEFGCGDGHQLALIKYPQYIGLDVSASVVARCQQMFAGDSTKSFRVIHDDQKEQADMGVSMDVIYHLVEDAVFESHMKALFLASKRYVVIFANNQNGGDSPDAPHMRNRRFTDWITQHCPDWDLDRYVPNRYPPRADGTGSAADFFFFKRRHTATDCPSREGAGLGS